MKKILIVCSNKLSVAPRFMMQVEALSKSFQIIAAGYDGQQNTNYQFIKLPVKASPNPVPIKFHLKLPSVVRKIISIFIRIAYFKHFVDFQRKHEKECLSLLNKISFDLIIVHHIWDLPWVVKLANKKSCKLILNAHEYYPLEFEDNPKWMLEYHSKAVEICRKYSPKINICFCVAPIIANKYFNEFGLKSVVIANTKPYENLSPIKNTGYPIQIVHHGAMLPSRRIELMIDMMDFLPDNYHLTLVLVYAGDKNYYEYIFNKADLHPKVSLRNPVPVDQIPKFLNQFDVGLYIMPHSNYNNKHALPNKFFEFVQARLMILIGPSPEMAEIVKKNDLGIVVENFEPQTFAKELIKMDYDRIMYYKKQSHIHAKELSDDTTKIKIKNTVAEIIN